MKPPFQVDIKLDQASVKVGSKLSGRIVLPNQAITDNTKGGSSGSIKSIQVRFLGWEETKVIHVENTHHTDDIHGTNRGRTVVERERHEVCSHILFEKSYSKGQAVDQTIPISFRLPKDLPASLKLSIAEAFGLQEVKPGIMSALTVDHGTIGFTMKDRSPDHAELTYKVQVDMERRGLLKRTLHFEKIVPVEAEPKSLTVGDPWECVPTIKAPKFKKLLGRGNVARKIYIGVRLPTGQHVEIGQNLAVDLSVINMSGSTIDKVEMTLQEKYKWHAKRYSRDAGDYHKEAKAFGWLGDSAMNPPPESAVKPEPSQLQQKMRNELEQATHRQILTIPNHCKPDFYGKLMTVTHVLHIHVTTKKMFGPGDIDVPITLHLSTTPPVAQPVGQVAGPVVEGRPVVAQNSPSPDIPYGMTPTPIVTEMIHRNVECDGCKQYPLRGVRYHCFQGKHDYCQNCCNANHHTCFIDKSTLCNFADVIQQQPFSEALSSDLPPPSSAAAPVATVPVAQGFHPMIERKVGDAAIWEDHPLPQATGFHAWIGKQLLGAIGIDPYAPMARQVPPVPFTPVPYIRPEDVCVHALCTQLANHPDPVSVVVQNLQQSAFSGAWQALLYNLKPEDFGDLVGSVPTYHRQSPVAEKMVPYIHNFSCQHLLEALKQAQCNGVRNRMLGTLTAYCVDYKQNKRSVKAELSDTEQAFFKSGYGYGRCCG